MRRFIVDDFGKWFHQNKAEYTGAFYEGTLLDNFVLGCKRGYAFVYERYETPNSSVYETKFAAYADSDECRELWEEFYERKDEYETAMWLNELAYKAREGSAA